MKLIYNFNVVVAVVVITFVTFTSGISYQCPSKCVCNTTTVKCVKKQLVDVPDFNRVYFNPDTIDLGENKIETIAENEFYSDNLKKLKYLQLDNNQIVDVEKASFVDLPSIEYIDLSYNQLEDIPSEVVEKNTKLLELNLSNNLFGTNTPTIISKSLLVLDLSSCKLTTFTEENVKATPNLTALFLHVNNLQFLDYGMFRHSSIKYLDVAYNPWKCHCDTVKLFDHLVKFGITTLKSTVQCLHSNKLFEDIYGSKGEISEINSEFCKKRPARIDNRKSIEIGNDEEIIVQNFGNHQSNVNSKENMLGFIMHFEVLIIVGIVSVLLVVSLITLAVVVRRTTPNQRVFYGKIPMV
ncbi:hypothetical protein FQR65_LT04149 [Abscondita terminalis]|nr:hypothetical protein FQR65_LT04149 [Abscondita terminalis]